VTRTLDGIAIVSLAVNIPGPVAVARLRDMGASVVKIEPPSGDPLQGAAPAWYAALHDGCTITRLNLRDVDDRAHLDALLTNAALLLTANRPSSLARLGLDWERLHARFPDLAHVAIVGERAPHGERPGHDLTYVAQAGLLDPPHLPTTLIADLGGAERAVSAALDALLHRARTGSATYREVALRDAAEAFALPLMHGLTRDGGNLSGSFGGYRLYRARDGWIALAALEPHFRQRFLHAVGLADWDVRELTAIFTARNAIDWERWAAAHDLPLVAVPLR
jgi:alpha-methylacyl-CoA racemase